MIQYSTTFLLQIIKNALIKAVQSNENFYTASEGLPELRQAIVEKEKGKGFDVTENGVRVQSVLLINTETFQKQNSLCFNILLI